MSLRGFYKPENAKASAVVSRPDLVGKRNAQASDQYSVTDNEAKRPAVTLSQLQRRSIQLDSRIRCYRPDGTCYAVVSPTQWAHLRETGKLAGWLDRQRESGVILEVK